MMMWVRHFAARLRAMTTDSSAWPILAFASLASLLWPWLLRPAPVDAKLLMIFNALLFLVLWPLMVMVPALGGAVPCASRAVAGGGAMPALPIGPRSRMTAESGAALVLVSLLRAVMLLLGEWLFGLRELLDLTLNRPSALVADTVIGASMMLPVMLAWASPGRIDRGYWLKPLLTAGVVLWIARAGLLETSLVGVPLCLAVAGAVLLLVGRGSQSLRLATFTRRAVVPYRKSPGPRAQFRRDQWLGPLRRMGYLLGLALVVSFGSLFVDYFVELSGEAKDLVHGGAFGFALGLFPLMMTVPLGLELFKTDLGRTPGALMSGDFCAAWSTSPVRSEWVVRGVYFHGFVGGLLLFSLILIQAGLAVLLDIHSARVFEFVLPLAFGIPSLAGLLVCTAIGDRLRGSVSLLALLLFLPVHVAFPMVSRLTGFAADHPEAVKAAVLALLALAGGVPPLVHLRRRPTATSQLSRR